MQVWLKVEQNTMYDSRTYRCRQAPTILFCVLKLAIVSVVQQSIINSKHHHHRDILVNAFIPCNFLSNSNRNFRQYEQYSKRTTDSENKPTNFDLSTATVTPNISNGTTTTTAMTAAATSPRQPPPPPPSQRPIENDDNDEMGTEDNDFSAWIVANLKQWPLLNVESPLTSLSPSMTEPNTTTSTTTRSNIWNDFGALLLQSTIGNVSSDATTTMLNARNSPSSQAFNFESILSARATTTTSTMIDTNNENATNMVISTAPSSTIVQNSNVSTGGVQPTLQPSYFIGIPDSILKQATSRIETIVTEASTVVSSDIVMTLINKASELVRLSSSSSSTSSTIVTSTTTKLPTVVKLQEEQKMNKTIDSLSPSFIRDSVTTYATSILRIADGLLRKGYVDGEIVAKKLFKGQESMLQNVPIVVDSQALFNEYRSVKEINSASYELVKSAEMGALAGAIYEDTIPRTHALRQTIVARGSTADVTWMISDSIANQTSFTTKPIDTVESLEPFLVRTITIRGFDASDESVDREQLLNQICTATPVQLWSNKGQQQQPQQQQQQQPSQLQDILVHSGILNLARAIYADIKVYVDWTSSSHKIVLNGHSIGGSVAILLLMLMIQDYGSNYIRKKIIQVYAFGSPPVVVMRDPTMNVLSALDLPVSFIQGFVQPWDPVVRLFTVIDPLYPLVSDLGPDNTTPFANGPPRALRPLLKSILVSWAGWPRFRDNYKGTAKQSYASIGVQHIILPEPTRYLADRFLAVNIPVPPIETIVQISSEELYPALTAIFPLDVFEVSYVPQAIRSFVHHFYPAYGLPLVDYVKELQRRSRGLPERKSELAYTDNDVPRTTARNGTLSTTDGKIDWGKATQWFTRYDSKS